MNATKKRGKRATRVCTIRQIQFARAVALGKNQSDAYREAYGQNKKTDKTLHEHASRMAALDHVAEQIAWFKEQANYKTILSINDRLGILARDAQLPGREPAMVGARARVIKVYNELAGDESPKRIELAGTGGAPVQIAADVTAAVVVRKETVREKIARLEAARAAEGAK